MSITVNLMTSLVVMLMYAGLTSNELLSCWRNMRRSSRRRAT